MNRNLVSWALFCFFSVFSSVAVATPSGPRSQILKFRALPFSFNYADTKTLNKITTLVHSGSRVQIETFAICDEEKSNSALIATLNQSAEGNNVSTVADNFARGKTKEVELTLRDARASVDLHNWVGNYDVDPDLCVVSAKLVGN